MSGPEGHNGLPPHKSETGEGIGEAIQKAETVLSEEAENLQSAAAELQNVEMTPEKISRISTAIEHTWEVVRATLGGAVAGGVLTPGFYLGAIGVVPTLMNNMGEKMLMTSAVMATVVGVLNGIEKAQEVLREHQKAVS